MLRSVFRRFSVIALSIVLAIAYATALRAQSVDVGASEIGGVVTSAKGPEAGVWVIAETTDLPTKFTSIVVTDDQGRYLIPDLPTANYSVWVRGYGWWIRPRCARSRASISITRQSWRRTKRRPRIIIRRSIGMRC